MSTQLKQLWQCLASKICPFIATIGGCSKDGYHLSSPPKVNKDVALVANMYFSSAFEAYTMLWFTMTIYIEGS